VSATLGGAATDVSGNLVNIENLTGGSGADTLTGDANANILKAAPATIHSPAERGTTLTPSARLGDGHHR
jgi:hypothetical protein